MLQYLKIKNLALLDSVTLEFEAGFTVVTGETGAGKSVLLGALALLAGARTDKTMIRQGADALEVEAALYFEDSREIDGCLEASGLPLCEDGVLLLKRMVPRSKMAKIQINGSLSTLSQLQELGEAWIDFHGPGEPQKLFQERRQLEMLDFYAEHTEALLAYRQAFAEWRAGLRELESLRTGERLDAEAIEFLRKQVKQIDALSPTEVTIEELERDYSRVTSAQELTQLASVCAESLNGEQGIGDLLSGVVARFEALADLDPGCGSLLERARSLLIELQDLGDETNRLLGDFDFDADAVAEVGERMHLWQDLRRKYGSTVTAVLEKRAGIVKKLEAQGDIEGLLQRKEALAREQEPSLKKAAAKLTENRKKAAKVLATKAAGLLKALGFKKAQLEISLISEPALHEYGDSRCCFLFSPNAGQDLLPLNRIASSGETARVMLALKTVLADADATPLLVFDEVDANVGGEVGRAVGAELARLAQRHQVMCVTHLPQVASLAQNHLVVTKSQEAASTSVSITPIGAKSEARLEELARMLGDRNSASARAHAAELLA